MREFDEIGTPAADGSITVGAGVTMLALRKALERHGLQIEVVPEIGNATAGSVACCGTKDASLGPGGLGQISSTVTGVRMVDPAGDVVGVTDPERLRVIRSSYGLLGTIVDVTFRTMPRRTLTYEYARLPVGPGLTLDAVRGAADGFLGFLLPHRRALLVERRTLAPGAGISLADVLRRSARDQAWERIGEVARLPVRDLWFPKLDLTLEGFLGGLGRFDARAGASMIDFEPDPERAFDFAFWAFGASTWERALGDYLALADDFLARTGFRSALPTEIYFIRRDDSALLSFCPDEDVFTLDLVDIVPRSAADEHHWQRLNDEFNDLAARHGARPLLNQTKFLSPRHMAALRRHWPPAIRERWARFAALRSQEDPAGRFLTPYFAALLDSPARP
jgi:FAD/FMN-containing dehydrogenase